MTIYSARKLFLLVIFLLSSSSFMAAERISPYQQTADYVSFDSVAALASASADFTQNYANDSAGLQFGMLWLPVGHDLEGRDKSPLIVFIHGGCWLNAYDIQHTFPFSTALAQAGYAVWSLEYRRTGDLGGGWPGTFEDIVQGIAFTESLESYPVDTDRMIIVGHSAGGHLALLAADTFPEIRGVIGLAAISDLVQYSQGNSSCQVDFAVGCGYKYLNGGPGAPAFIYAAQRHHANLEQPLRGWMGHKAPFAFSQHYQPAPGVQQFLTGTPPVLSMSTLDAALSIFARLDMQTVREKSLALGNLFLALIHDATALDELTLISPLDPAQRGSQLAFSHPLAFSISQALIARKVIVDFRAPDILRLGLSPLYISFQDIWNSVEILKQVLTEKSYQSEKYSSMQKVT